MDVAAQETTKLVQHVLPDRPYHLSVSATARYPVPPGLWPNTSPLQYTTYVSEADRGILLTRPYFDIQPERDETAKGCSNNRVRALSSADAASSGGTPGAANGKGEPKKPVTKMSFKDYQQSKQLKKISGSPSDALGTSKPSDARPSKDTDSMASVERQRLPQKPELNGDKRNHSLEKSPKPAAPSPSAGNNRKRTAELNDPASRPHKRSRSDTSMSSNSPPPASSTKLPGRLHDPPSPFDLDSRRDERPRPTTNGTSSQASQRDKYRDREKDGDKDREPDRDRDRDRRDRDRDRDRDKARDRDRERERDRDKGRDLDRDKDRYRDRDRDRDRDRGRDRARRRSPPSPTAPKVNGHKLPRDRNRGQDRDRSRSPDDEGGPISSLPPILSPLHFNPERGSEPTTKRPRASTVTGSVSSKVKSEPSKKDKSPFRIPPLLSPTLPAIIEEELSRLKKIPLKESDPKPLKSSQDSGYGATSGKKPFQPAPDTEMEDVGYKAAPHKDNLKEKVDHQRGISTSSLPKRSLIVTLKYKKKNAKRVQRLLALQPTPSRGLSAKQLERAVSIENTPSPAQPITKKRPVSSDISTNELLPPPHATSSFKHPKTFAEKGVTAPRVSAGPGTPVKSTPMARGASNTSQIPTPGDSTSLTPRSSERPPTSQGGVSSDHNATNLTVTDYRRRYDTYLKMGTKLKHDRDAIVKSRMSNGATTGAAAKSDGAGGTSGLVLTASEKKLVATLSLEMVMSYLIAFKSLNQGRHLERKPGDITVWERLMPHFAELRSHARHFRPLEAMTVQLRAICFEQMLASFVGHEAEAVASKLMVATKQRIDAWAEVATCMELVHDNSLKTVIGPWMSIEDTVRSLLPVMRRWNERENAGWDQELQAPAR